jgi:hypothetical protein
VSSTEVFQAVVVKPLFTLPVEMLRIVQQVVGVVHF